MDRGAGRPRDAVDQHYSSGLELGGRNLANVYHLLRGQTDWPDTLARIQLALGDRIKTVTTPADPSGGRIGLAIRVPGVGEVPSFAMSDGQLASSACCTYGDPPS